MALALQPPTTTLSPRPPTTHRSPQRANQPSWDVHLGGGRGEAELDASEEELSAVRQLSLLGHPSVGFVDGDPVSPGHELSDEGDEEAPVGVRIELVRREGMALELDGVKACRLELRGEGLWQRWMR